MGIERVVFRLRHSGGQLRLAFTLRMDAYCSVTECSKLNTPIWEASVRWPVEKACECTDPFNSLDIGFPFSPKYPEANYREEQIIWPSYVIIWPLDEKLSIFSTGLMRVINFFCVQAFKPDWQTPCSLSANRWQRNYPLPKRRSIIVIDTVLNQLWRYLGLPITRNCLYVEGSVV